MKAIILCAGEGTRLRPLTFSIPKHLIPVANKPVILRALETIKETGITNIGIVVSPNRKESFTSRLGDGSTWGVKISYILQEEPRGLAHAVQCSRDFIQKEPFLVYLGDNLLQASLVDMITKWRRNNFNALVTLYKVSNPQRFGVAILANGKITKLVEKPTDPPSNLAVTGIYLFDSYIFEAIDKITPSSRGELEITDAIQKLIDEGLKVSPYYLKGWWKDVGKPEDILEANQLILENEKAGFYKVGGEIDSSSQIRPPVKVDNKAKIKNSELRGPCIIGSGAKVYDSLVRPFTSIGKEVNLIKSEIGYSMVMEKSKIEGVGKLNHSLIGKHVQIIKKQGQPGTYNFVLGNGCRMCIEK